MNQFVFLLVSGVLWLGLVTLAPDLGFEPQWVSLFRAVYLGMFSIALITDLRSRGRSEDENRSPTPIWFNLVPVISVLVYATLGSTKEPGWRELAIFGSFFAMLLLILGIRERLQQMRAGKWELLPPLGLGLCILFGVYLFPFLIIACIWFYTRKSMKSGPVDPKSIDSIIMQLPSFCIAPVILILLRDTVYIPPGVSRSTVEVMGLVSNGVGAALWTAIVMRANLPLRRFAIGLWAAGGAGGLILPLVWPWIEPALLQVLGALFLLELLRGAGWILTTYFLTYMARWKGALMNLAMTLLPLLATMAIQFATSSRASVFIYALALSPPFLFLIGDVIRDRRTPPSAPSPAEAG